MNRLALLLSVVVVMPAIARPKKSIPPRPRTCTFRQNPGLCDRHDPHGRRTTKGRIELLERTAPEFAPLVQAPSTFEPASR